MLDLHDLRFPTTGKTLILWSVYLWPHHREILTLLVSDKSVKGKQSFRFYTYTDFHEIWNDKTKKPIKSLGMHYLSIPVCQNALRNDNHAKIRVCIEKHQLHNTFKGTRLKCETLPKALVGFHHLLFHKQKKKKINLIFNISLRFHYVQCINCRLWFPE